MVNGYLATIYTTDGGGGNASFAFWNVSNATSPVRVYNYYKLTNSKLREPHGFGFTNGYSNKTYFIGQSTTGFQIWDWSNPAAATLVKDVVLTTPTVAAPGVNGGDYSGVWWLHVQAPYVFVAGGDAGLFVVDISNPTSPSVIKQVEQRPAGHRPHQPGARDRQHDAGELQRGRQRQLAAGHQRSGQPAR